MKDLKTTLQAILSHYSPEEQAEITYAYRMAENAMKEKLRENRHPFIEHPLGVAQIIAEDLCLGADSVIALFLHETLRFYPEALETVPKGTFSEEVLNIALNLNKIALIKPKETRLEAENYKRLILSYSKDPRVTLVKLADRLDVMRNIRLLSKSSQERKVTETMLLYIPIAHQLGLYNLKSELENIFFKCTEPEKYREISNKLSATEGERAMLVKSFIEPLKQKISKAGIKATFKQRTKCAYSIWKKMQKQGVPFEGVKDLLAIRIIIDAPDNREEEVALCWNAYSIVTEQYIPDLSRLRDWLSKPKSNGYESLHITVSDTSGHSLEVQIRTDRMDRIAEKGHASHWSYKGVKEEREVAGWLNSVRETLEKGAICYEYQSKYLKEEVFVFTPDGALRRLPKGATILDFAFDIHTNLGIRCSGALVDGKPAQIKEELHTGEVIEIKTSKKQKPSVDWLSFVVTSKARNKIRLKLKEEALKKSQAGRELLERRLKNWKEVMNDEDIMVFIKKYKLKSISDFYEAIENESIDLMTIKNFLANKYHNTEESPALNPKSPAMVSNPPGQKRRTTTTTST